MPPTDLIAFNRKKPVEQWPLLSPLSSPKFPLPNNVEAISGPRFHQTIAIDIFSRGPPHLCPPGLVDTPSERRPSMFSGHRWLQQPHQHPQHQQQQSLTCASVYAVKELCVFFSILCLHLQSLPLRNISFNVRQQLFQSWPNSCCSPSDVFDGYFKTFVVLRIIRSCAGMCYVKTVSAHANDLCWQKMR